MRVRELVIPSGFHEFLFTFFCFCFCRGEFFRLRCELRVGLVGGGWGV